jgi:hypothetical protein
MSAAVRRSTPFFCPAFHTRVKARDMSSCSRATISLSFQK